MPYDESPPIYGKRSSDAFDFDFMKRDFDYDFMKRHSRPDSNGKRGLSLFDYWLMIAVVDLFLYFFYANAWNWTFPYFPAIKNYVNCES